MQTLMQEVLGQHFNIVAAECGTTWSPMTVAEGGQVRPECTRGETYQCPTLQAPSVPPFCRLGCSGSAPPLGGFSSKSFAT